MYKKDLNNGGPEEGQEAVPFTPLQLSIYTFTCNSKLTILL
jgi:hypothetical protein